MITSLVLQLLANVPVMIFSVILGLMSCLRLTDNSKAERLTNYWTDYQIHVLDLHGFFTVLFLFIFPPLIQVFYFRLGEIDHRTAYKLLKTNYHVLFPSRPTNTTRAFFKPLSDFLEINLKMITNHISLIVPSITFVSQMYSQLVPFLNQYIMDTIELTFIHLLSHIPYIGILIPPLMTFYSIYWRTGQFTAFLAAFITIPGVVPLFLIPCGPRSMFSIYKSPTHGGYYQSETSYFNIMPLFFYFNLERLLNLFTCIYFSHFPFSERDKQEWIQSRSGILIGYIITVYLLTCILGPFGLFSLAAGLSGTSEIMVKLTTPPPRAQSAEQSVGEDFVYDILGKSFLTNSLEYENLNADKFDSNFQQNTNIKMKDQQDHQLPKTPSSAKLLDMKRLSEWMDKESFRIFERKELIKDFIDGFHNF
ncbi:hypothetical protein DAMA08_050330 [Martiniozyma asiatica (nom. inval.)]|nr:hypothetical protein DAMA08_050330 [Martiniozyma asiatica]